MRKWLYRLLAFVLVAGGLAALLLAGGTAEVRLFPELTQDVIAGWPTSADALEQSAELLGLDKMRRIAESNGTELYYHETTGELAVKTASGEVWYSNPQNRLDFDLLSQGHYTSLLYANVITANESEKTMYSFDDCMQYGQAKTVPMENGLRVEYLFGRTTKQGLYPQALTEERYEEIAKQLSADEVLYFSRYYTLADISRIEDQQVLDTLKETYTRLEQLQRIYVLKNNPSVLEVNRLLSYFEKIGYTAADRDADNERTGYQAGGSDNSHFLLPVEYTLEDGRLRVRARVDEMSALGLLKVESLVLLPFWNTEGGMSSTTVIVPDGSGAIMDLGRTVSSSVPDYEERVFGEDYSLYRTSRTSVKEPVFFPLYGLINADGGFFAEATEGAASASVLVTPHTADKPVGTVGFRFKLLDYATTKLLSTDTDTVRSYPDNADLSPIEVTFTFPAACRDFMDIAAAYRGQLAADGKLSAFTETAVPAVVQILGAVDDLEPFLGIPKEKLRALTTYEQAGELIDRLAASLPENQLVIQYSGWQKGGVKSGPASLLKAEKQLGGDKAFQSMLEDGSSKGVEIYPDTDFQYVYRDSAFDGFSASRDAARTVVSEKAYKPTYSPANFNADADRLFGFVVSPTAMAGMADSVAGRAGGYGLNGAALPYIGRELSGDFTEERYISRNAALTAVQDMLKTLREAELDLMAGGANAYVLPYIDYAYGVPMQANGHPLVTETVPFVQAVLSGSVRYAASPLNRATDLELYLLKCIETGSAPYATLMAADDALLKDTAYDTYGSVSAASQMERVCRISREVAQALAPVYGSRMTAYASDGGVVRVAYDNGVTIVVNYTGTAVRLPEGVWVDARSYVQIQGVDE
ncbi:MAG TPA: hypothetical protein H9684_02870 [Firmicutes bacterium]|nr:hypothetical protein [Bacillota bacterium]